MLTIRLQRDQETALDILARSRGESKSQFVRRLIDGAIKGSAGAESVFEDIREFRKTVKPRRPVDIKALLEEGRR